MADLTHLIKLHKVENDPEGQKRLAEAVAADELSLAKNRAALATQRAADGHVSAVCPKCGAESVFEAKNKGAKCGAMTGVQSMKTKDGEHNVPAPCGTPLVA